MPAQPGGTEWLGVEPLGRPVERGHLQTFERLCIVYVVSELAEPGPDLGDEQLRLLPGGEVPALVELVVVDELGIGRSAQLPRHCVELVGEDAHGHRDRDALRVEEAELVLRDRAAPTKPPCSSTR